MTERKAAIGDLIRMKLGVPKRIGQLATITSATPTPRRGKRKGTYIRYRAVPEGESKVLVLSCGHFDVVRRARS